MNNDVEIETNNFEEKVSEIWARKNFIYSVWYLFNDLSSSSESKTMFALYLWWKSRNWIKNLKKESQLVFLWK